MEHLPNVEQEPTAYRAFILRWWQEECSTEGIQPKWRFLVEDIHNRQSRWGFKSMPELVQFLQSELVKTHNDETVLGVFEPIQQHTDD